MRSDGPTLDQIGDMLRGRIDDLVQRWQLRGIKDGRDFVAYNPLRVDNHLGSFRVALEGKFKGLVKDFSGDQSWSPLSFTAQLWFHGDVKMAIRWAKGYLGLDGSDPDSLRKTRRSYDQYRSADDVAADEQALKKRKSAYSRYLEASTELLGSPVDGYLLGRAIDLRRFLFPLRSLRFHSKLWNVESKRHWPAMVAPIVGMDGKFLGLHRTWLEVLADGRVRKAPVGDNKKSLGSYRGGVIRLWNGYRVDPETGEIKPGLKLRECRQPVEVDLTEGIEDGLSVAVELQELRVCAGVSISNMMHLEFPANVGGVCLWRQNDRPGSDAARDFSKVVANQLAQGKRVRVAEPPEGVKDVNDVLVAENQGI